MLASGTRGDVEPCVALGIGLQGAGIPVVIAAPPRFQELIEGGGVGYSPLDGNPSDLMGEGSDAMAATLRGGALRGIAATARFLRSAQAEYARMLASAAAAAGGARAIVIGLSSTWGASIAEALGVPCIRCMVQPWGRTSAFPSPLLPLRVSLGRPLNAASYRLVEQAIWQPWRRVTNTWRRKTLGLPPLPPAGPWKAQYASGFSCLYGFSAAVLPPPADWPPSHLVTGYWFLPPDEEWAPTPALERFLAPGNDGNLPLYIGFGSMGLAPAARAAILRALEAANARAVICAPGLPQGEPSKGESRRAFFADDIPHDWLFPRVSAVFHHGGAGTTAQGLRAGVPAIILPGASDQYFWGRRVALLGAGLSLATRHPFDAGVLSAAFRRVLDDLPMRHQARRIGERIRAENGVAAAVAALLPLVG
jgi:sterol 3beta-glucosyltransferase